MTNLEKILALRLDACSDVDEFNCEKIKNCHECATYQFKQIEADIRADERKKVLDEFEASFDEAYHISSYCFEDYCKDDTQCDGCLELKVREILKRMKGEGKTEPNVT